MERMLNFFRFFLPGRYESLLYNKWMGLLLLFIITTGFYTTHSVHFGEAKSFDRYSQPIPGSGQSIEMVPIPGGTFMMGSPEDEQGREADEGPRHKVRVDSFWMGVYEITWDQYDLFVKEEIEKLEQQIPASPPVKLEADAVSLPTPPYIDMSFGMGRDGYPAINMTHYAAVMFTKWLTAKTGHFYRLPTEAEWEYACRAGSSTAYHYGEDPAQVDAYAWHKGNSDGKYHQIGKKKPNSWGLYDIYGNVAEWTMDQYVEDYFSRLEGEPADNPWVRPDKLYPRSLRGGSWQDEPAALRCAERRGSRSRWKRRDPQLPKSRWWLTDAPFLGFRVIRPVKQSTRQQMEAYWIEPMDDY